MAATSQLKEKTLFKRDSASTDEDKNSQLSDLLQDNWMSLAIVRVERIEIGDSGWRVTYRE
jgi:hypothetical protein